MASRGKALQNEQDGEHPGEVRWQSPAGGWPLTPSAHWTPDLNQERHQPDERVALSPQLGTEQALGDTL